MWTNYFLPSTGQATEISPTLEVQTNSLQLKETPIGLFHPCEQWLSNLLSLRMLFVFAQVQMSFPIIPILQESIIVGGPGTSEKSLS